VSLLAFLACVIAAGELYCRFSPRFLEEHQDYIREIMNADAKNAVFGDSHVGYVSRIPGYAFLGFRGQDPEELLMLVKYLYTYNRPGNIIVIASPQWFGRYHSENAPVLSEGSLPNRWLPIPLLILSKNFLASIRANAQADLLNLAVQAVRADEPEQMLDPKAALAILGRMPQGSDWSTVPKDVRFAFTSTRVQAHNPTDNFASSAAAGAYEEALRFLMTRGAKLCLYRTPVTSLYLDLAYRIPGTRFAEFDDYAAQLASRLGVKRVDFHSLPYSFADRAFADQDHLLDASATELWPLVEQACFH